MSSSLRQYTGTSHGLALCCTSVWIKCPKTRRIELEEFVDSIHKTAVSLRVWHPRWVDGSMGDSWVNAEAPVLWEIGQSEIYSKHHLASLSISIGLAEKCNAKKSSLKGSIELQSTQCTFPLASLALFLARFALLATKPGGFLEFVIYHTQTNTLKNVHVHDGFFRGKHRQTQKRYARANETEYAGKRSERLA